MPWWVVVGDPNVVSTMMLMLFTMPHSTRRNAKNFWCIELERLTKMRRRAERLSIDGSLEAFALSNTISESGVSSIARRILVPPVSLGDMSNCALSELGRV